MTTTDLRPGLEAVENAPVEELRDLQLGRLQHTVRHAYDHVPHYRRALDGAGLRPDDVQTLADLARLPFTTKSDLRENYPFGMFAVPRAQVARVHASSGTTGQPTVVGYTAADLDVWAGVAARSLYAAGARPGDLLHNAYGYGLFTGGLGVHAGAERLGCTVVPVSGGMTERQVRLIADFAPRVICVTPSYMLAIGDEMRRQGIDPRSTSLTTLLGVTDSTAQAHATVRVAPVPAVVRQRVDLDSSPLEWPLAHPLFVALDLAQDVGRGREILDEWTPDDRWTRVW